MILEQINKANDIKNVDVHDLPQLADEIRGYIIDTVGTNGGHLSSSLGVVELTMALHLALDFPKDKLIWDVGHQSYAHKILSGRRVEFKTLRQEGGISGFPNRKESDCDPFGTGHATTSLSAALGMVAARDLAGENNYVVAVIGDGALTGGMAYEALNNAGNIKSNLIIILNDNDMSISRNVGGISNVLNEIRTGRMYNDIKDRVKNTISKIPGCGDNIVGRIHKTKSSIKQAIVPGMVFEDMGITYLGPVDGHDINRLVRIINMAKRVKHAVIIHVHTTKGKGYKYAENNPCYYHGVDPFDVSDGKCTDSEKVRNYSDVFSSAVCKMAENDEKVVAITAAMSEGCGLVRFEKKFRDRFFDVGIAEEHAVTFAAGMAAEGYKPFVAIYSSFLQRSFDQILHDVCIQNLPVKFVVERAGIVGRDGITHQGIFDLSYLNIIPGMTVMAPKNRFEFRDMLFFAKDYNGPIAVRVPRGRASDIFNEIRTPIEYGRSEILIEGKDVAIIAVGTGVEIADEVCRVLRSKGVEATLVNGRFIKPVDEKLIERLSENHRLLVTIEENVVTGAFGMNVLNYVNTAGLDVSVYNAALPDGYIGQGDPASLRNENGLAPEKIAGEIMQRIKQ